MISISIIIAIACIMSLMICIKLLNKKKQENKNALYVNYHLTRQCNYQCGFCFHTAKTSHVLQLDEAKQGLKLLAEYGGEPFMQKKFLGELLKYCKQVLKIEITSVVSNGSIIHNNRRWFDKYGKYLDVFAISCDSFKDDVNKQIGRYNKSKANQTEIVENCANLCHKYKIAFKLNTVVNSYNWNENMVQQIERLNPIRWKVFQCLLVNGENDGNKETSLRDARRFLISDQQFKSFVKTHESIKALVAEDNSTMRNSYVLLDEYMRFLNNSNGGKEPSQSILEIGVENALKQTYFDKDSFDKRDGNYAKTKLPSNNTKSQCTRKDLEW